MSRQEKVQLAAAVGEVLPNLHVLAHEPSANWPPFILILCTYSYNVLSYKHSGESGTNSATRHASQEGQGDTASKKPKQGIKQTRSPQGP